MAGGGEDHHPAAATAATKEPPPLSTLRLVFLDSIKILLFNAKLFSSIFLLFALPLSLLLFTLSASTATLRRRISHLESLAAIISIRIEALNILEEARKDAIHLFRLRAFYAIPSLLLSTVILISSAAAAASPLLHRRRFAFSDITSSLRSSWWRGLLTGSVAHLSLAGFGQLSFTAAVAASAVCGPVAALVLGLFSAAAEIYITSVFAVGTVVSVVEDRFGLDAFRIGSGLMAGRRAVGWTVTAAVAAVTGVIGWEMVGMEEIDVYGGDLLGFGSTAVMEIGRKGGLVFLYGLVLVWSNVVATVFYCDCRRKKVVMEEDDQIMLVDTVNEEKWKTN